MNVSCINVLNTIKWMYVNISHFDIIICITWQLWKTPNITVNNKQNHRIIRVELCISYRCSYFFSNHFLRKHVCTLHEIPVMFVPLLEMLKTSWISSKTTKHLTDYKKAYSCWFNVKKINKLDVTRTLHVQAYKIKCTDKRLI